MPTTITKIYNFVGQRWVIAILLGIAVTAFALRVVFPLQIVFGNEYVNYLEGDAYSRMYYAKQIIDMPFIDGFWYVVPRGLLFPWLIAVFGHILPIELVGAWLPPIVAMGVIIVVYLIGREVFNPIVGLLGALFVAIIPSEFFHRSLLGYPDHHVMEVLLMALAVWLVVKVIKRGSILNRYTYCLGAVMFLYLANWTGGIILTGLIGVMILILLIRRNTRRPALGLMSGLVIGNVLYIALGGFLRYFWWFPGVENSAFATQSASMVSERMTSLFAPITERTTSELMPLLMPAGEWNVSVVVYNLHFFTLLFFVGLVFLWFWRKDKANLFIIIWAVALLVITVNERRFLYYFTLPVGLLSAWGLYELGQIAKKNAYLVIVMGTVILVVVSLPVLLIIGTVQAYTMPPEWHDALVWLDDEPDVGNVTAWSDYGHWIQYVTGKMPNLFNGPGGKDVAKLFLTEDDEEAQVLLADLNTGYLIIDRGTLDYKVEPLEIVAGEPAGDNPITRRLLDGGSVSYLNLVYESENIKIYALP